MKQRRSLYGEICLASILWLQLLGCTDNGGADNAGGGVVINPDPEPIANQLSVSPSTVVLAQLGASASLQLSGTDANGQSLDTLAATWRSSDAAVATVTSSGMTVAVSEGQATLTATLGQLSATAMIIVDTTAYTLSGTVRYLDKEYNRQGFTGNSNYKSLRFAVVELLGGNGTVLSTTVTDSTGAYQLGPFVDTSSQVRVRAQSNHASLPNIEIVDYSGNLYAVSKPVTLSGTQSSMDIDINEVSGAGAYNIYDVYVLAAQHIGTLSSASLPDLKAVWQSGSSQLGTWFCQTVDLTYCPQGRAIYLLGGGAPFFDTDEYDDDVLWHEFSHYLELFFNTAQSPGGAHAFTDNELDLRLSWSEGLGDFLPTAMKAWLLENNAALLSTPLSLATSIYIDTSGNVASMVDIGDPGGSPFVYASNEIAIAHVLDQLREQFGMQAIWTAYESGLPALTATPINLEAFWDVWLSQYGSVSLPQLEAIYAERSIFYQQDAFEDDDGQDQAGLLVVCESGQPCSGQAHYLYSKVLGMDRDFIQFNASAGNSYVIETFGLFNGADTQLSLYDNSGALLDQNDDRPGTVCCLPNDDLTLSSRVSFTAANSAAYFIEVMTSTDYAVSAGRYGSYSLKITEQ